jgi:hypothetical protein
VHLGGFGASGLGANGVDNKGTMWYGSRDLFFDGIRVAMANGLPSNKMVAAQSSNLFFGTGFERAPTKFVYLIWLTLTVQTTSALSYASSQEFSTVSVQTLFFTLNPS